MPNAVEAPVRAFQRLRITWTSSRHDSPFRNGCSSSTTQPWKRLPTRFSESVLMSSKSRSGTVGRLGIPASSISDMLLASDSGRKTLPKPFSGAGGVGSWIAISIRCCMKLYRTCRKFRVRLRGRRGAVGSVGVSLRVGRACNWDLSKSRRSP